MSRKRKNTSSPESSPEPPAKRRASLKPSATPPQDYSEHDYDSLSDDPDERPQLNQESGQTGAFPGLGGNGAEEDLFYGPAGDGIEYLRMVRSEARGVPSLLTAPAQRCDEGVRREAIALQDGEQGEFAADAVDTGKSQMQMDARTGRYSDGTYIAPPSTTSPIEGRAISSAQIRYYEVLLAQFRALLATLRCTPPIDKIRALSSEMHPISFPSEAENQWRDRIFTAPPDMVQISCVDQQSAWNLMLCIKSVFHQRTDTIVKSYYHKRDSAAMGLGIWAWAILARLPDLGTMDSAEVSELRAFGKIAADLLDVVSGHGMWSRDDPAAKKLGMDDLRQRTAEGSSQRHGDNIGLEMTLDMIITIVGEIFGQRDLLERRLVWEKSAPGQERVDELA